MIITVRSDHLGSVAVDPGLSRLVEQGLYLMGPLGGAELREAIEQPAAIAGLRLEDGLVELLLRDADGAAGALPLLSHSLVETWRRREGHVLTVEGYRASGGIRGAVARTAERLHDSLPADEQAALRTVLLRLVTATNTGEPVRRRVQTRTLLGDPRRERVVALLVRSRLVTADEFTVEIAHEALIRAWPRLQGWLDEDVAGRQILRHLSTASDDWEALGRPDSELLRGARLQSALDWRSAAAPDLTATEAAYLDASAARTQADAREIADRAVREARQNRRLRGLLAAASLFLVLSLVAGLVAWGSRQDIGRERDAALAAQDDARIEALVNRSLALRSTDRGVAALLAVEAYRRRPDARSLSALLGTFTAAPTFLGRRYVTGDSVTGALIPGSDSAVVAVDDAPPVVLDLVDGAREERFGAGAEGPSLLAVSAGGRVTARVTPTGDAGGTLALFETGTGRGLGGAVEIGFPPSSVALSADGSLVAVAGGNAEAAWYRTDDGGQVGTLPGLPARREPGGLPLRRPLRHRGRDLRDHRHAVRRLHGRPAARGGPDDVGGRWRDRGTGALLGEPSGHDSGRRARGGWARRDRRGRPGVDDAPVVGRHPGQRAPRELPVAGGRPVDGAALLRRLLRGHPRARSGDRGTDRGAARPPERQRRPPGGLPRRPRAGRLRRGGAGRLPMAARRQRPDHPPRGTGTRRRTTATTPSGSSLLVAARPPGSTVFDDFHDFTVWDPGIRSSHRRPGRRRRPRLGRGGTH